MSVNLSVVDTNILVRFLVDDVPDQVDRVQHLFEDSASCSLFIPDLVLAEVVYVLESVYKFERRNIVEKLSVLIRFDRFVLDKELLKTALGLYGMESSVSFVDAYLAALVSLRRNSEVITFDKKLMKVVGKKSREP